MGVTLTTDASHNNTGGDDARRLAGDNCDDDSHRRSIDDKEAYARRICILFRKYERTEKHEYFSSDVVVKIILDRCVVRNRRKRRGAANIRGVRLT